MNPRRRGWCPPHCPNPKCRYHNVLDSRWRYKRKGFFSRRTRPYCIQRFQCLHCQRTFSSQTFSTTYWLKRPHLISQILRLVVGAMANRQIARALDCAPSTVALQIARLARHCMLFHALELERLPPVNVVAIDGFETFECSQYFPFHHNLAVDVDTGYVLFHTDSPLRRKGRMTALQKHRRKTLEARHGRPDPHAVRKGIQMLLATIARRQTHIVIRSDDHRAYPPAIRTLECRYSHQVTPSKDHRDRHNALFEINLLDAMIRHSLAPHRRETIAWAKRRQSSAEKLTIFIVWRNYFKRRAENGPPHSAAMLCSIAHRLFTPAHLLRKRLFRSRTHLPPPWHDYYDRAVRTPAIGVNRAHTLTYAY